MRLAQAATAHRDTSVSALCRELGIRPVTLYRYVGPQGQLRERFRTWAKPVLEEVFGCGFVSIDINGEFQVCHNPRTMTHTVQQQPEALARLRLLVSVLGGAPHANWWRTEFLTVAGLRFLDRLYPRTSCAAAVRATGVAATELHDSNIGRGSVALQIQDRFLTLVRTEGWPPDGVMRHTEVFDRMVAPPLEQRERVAFFLGDALRFEMGRDLGEALGDLGEVETTALASVLPTITPCGMAALMPGADGALSLVESGGDLVPAIGTRLLKVSDDRMRFLKERYGDRFTDITLGELLSTSVQKLGKRIGNAELLVVRTQDIDALGENLNLYLARKLMSEMLGEMRRGAGRLATLGFQHLDGLRRST